MDLTFWQNRRVFVTGHTGFKGAWLTLWLRRMGAIVTGYSLPPPTQPNLYTLAGAGTGIRSIEGDIRDLDTLRAAMREANPEVVLHLAAQSLVRVSYADPVETFSSNVMGTVHVLEAARSLAGLRSIVVITSDKCYENREWCWGYRENEPMGGHDPYSSSKGCAELVTAAFQSSYYQPQGRVGLVSARAGNVIGGGDWARDRLVPDLMRSFMTGGQTLIRNRNSVRPYQHVLESLRGYLELARRAALDPVAFTGGWNFGPSESNTLTTGELADRLARLWGEGAGWRQDSGPQPHEANMLKLDSSKAAAHLAWRPRLDIHSTLEWVAEWYKACHRGEDLAALSAEQLRRYESLTDLR